MLSKHILATIALMLACASVSARSVRDVLEVWGFDFASTYPGDVELDLSRQGIDDLDGLEDAGIMLPNLKRLNLSGNQIVDQSEPTYVGSPTRPKDAGSQTEITEHVPKKLTGDIFLNFKKLEGLHLGGNRIENLGWLEVLGRVCPNLEGLNLRNNKIAVIPEGIFLRFNKLEGLNLSSNKIAHLFDGAIARSLRTINALRRGERVQWSSFAGLESLKVLFLHNNLLSTLPQSFSNLTALEELGLNKNHLSALPKNFGNLKSLKKLRLDENNLSTLPESFGHLTSLQTVDLGKNKLSILPESFGNLRALQKLWLYDNRLDETYNAVGYGGLNPLRLLRKRAILRVRRVTSLHQLLGDLPLSKIALEGNNLDRRVIDKVREALPDAEVES